MKTRIFLEGKEIFSSTKISKSNLEKKVNELKKENACQKVSDQVRRKIKVFTS